MPLVRIDLKNDIQCSPRRLGQSIYDAMRKTIGVPPYDTFQVINEHDGDTLIADQIYLDIVGTQADPAACACRALTTHRSLG